MNEKIKYKLNELAKALNVSNNDLINLLGEAFGGAKKDVTALTDE